MGRDKCGVPNNKYPKDTSIDPKLQEAVRQKAADQHLQCREAHQIADTLGIPAAEVGVALDVLEIKIVKCQMGLFGHSPEKKITRALEAYSADVAEAIRSKLQGGKISCKSCWDIADQFKMSKMDVAGVAEAINVKISPCQLGAF
jgi:hypothetical protein